MGISIWQLLILLLIVLLLFGTKRLRSAGTDLGAAIKNFKGSMKDEEQKLDEKKTEQGRVIEGESHKEKSDK